MFYMLTQNNSFGEFRVDSKLCHHMIIEADNGFGAVCIAMELGCYWNGVAKGLDCPCCGDRWSSDIQPIDLEQFRRGYIVTAYGYDEANSAMTRWYELYGKYTVTESPTVDEATLMHGKLARGRIKFRNLEEYVQFLADEYPGTIPDARIFYKDGTVKEFECKRTLWK